MKSLLKDAPIQVLLNDEDHRELVELLRLERRERNDVRLGKGTLLRDYGMPAVRQRLAALKAKVA